MRVILLGMLLVGLSSCSSKNIEVDPVKVQEAFKVLGSNDEAIAKAFAGIIGRIEVLEKKNGIVRATPTPTK
jgi:hypothetical protein